jgi:hypothetical protein
VRRGLRTLGVVDLSLAILIALTILYTGAVTLLVVASRDSMPAARTAAARAAVVVAAAFLLMILLARVALPATMAVAAVFALLATRRALLDDLGPRTAAGVAIATAVGIGTAFFLFSYLAVMALIGALGVYQLLRLRLRTRPALVVTGGTLIGLLAAAAATFAVALATM